MLVLAIDSATPVAGVALLSEEKLIKEVFLNYKKTHSQTLMVMVNEILQEAELGLDELDAIAVSTGPGSFTGLRIGLATAKGLAMGSGKPLVGVPTLDALAYNVCMFEGLICPLLDARKQEVYTALYRGNATGVERISDYRACSPQELVSDLQKSGAKRLLLLGDGVLRYRDYFQQSLDGGMILPPVNLILPRASSIGILALERLRQHQTDDVFSLVPIYLRLSEAENRLGLGVV